MENMKTQEIIKHRPIDADADIRGRIQENGPSLYDFGDDESDFYKLNEGLTPEIVSQLSEEKHDPSWMLDFRLHSLEVYNKQGIPQWGPPIDGLDMQRIVNICAPEYFQ